MSGGSYNYLCTKGVDELTPHNDDLAHMIERLDGIGWATAGLTDGESEFELVDGATCP